MKYKIDILCDEWRVADSLHELGTMIECGDLLDQMQDGSVEVSGDHFMAEIKEVKISWCEKLYAIVMAARQLNFSDEIDDIETLTYTDKKGNVHEGRFDSIDTTTIPFSVRFIAGKGHKNPVISIGCLTNESIDILYKAINH